MKIPYKGTTLYYTDEGKGTTLVFLHGFLLNANIWSPLKPQLLDKYRIVTIDLLGHGKTGCIGYIHSMEMMAEAVDHILKHLKIRKSVFIGHSMGGYVSLAFAEQNPDAVKGLVLLNSTARADSEEKKRNRDRGIKMVKENASNFIRMGVINLFRPKNRKIFSKEIYQIKVEALQTPVQGVVAALEGMKMRQDREVLLHFSPYPKMLVTGKKDPVLPFDTQLDMIKNTDVNLSIQPDGHMSFLENKDAFIADLRNFLKSF
ncbi:alpha/beta fold hydrolase [Zhouia sp. PK063]|uniref:alpha/beta fold hydrolase n=1 Tax=Zhouia sp. PK063 TaxID=3373602 RepID=UPI00379193FC